MAAQVEATQHQSGGGADASLTAGDPSQADSDVNSADGAEEEIEKTRTLICALNFLSRNLPLPQDVFDAVSSIYHAAGDDDGAADAAAEEEELEEDDVAERGVNNRNDDSDVVGGGGVGSGAVVAEKAAVKDGSGMSSYGDLMADFEVAVLKQRQSCMSGSGLVELKENRFQSQIHHRIAELNELPASSGEDLQSRCLLELYGLQLSDLQNKVRSEVSAEYWLRLLCTNPESQLFDWGMMRLRHPLYGIGDAFAADAEDPQKKKREVERWSRFEEERRILEEAAQRKFFADLVNACREFQLQVLSAPRRRRSRNDGVQAWHAKQRQRASRAEKLRFQALKNDDQEAYMKMVEESKNERLTMLLGKTNDLLVRLGAAVQRQKDAESEGIEPLEGSDLDLPELSVSKIETPGIPRSEEDKDISGNESNSHGKKSDLLEGQRQYNSAVHSIEEKVTEQPAMLQGGELRSYQLEGLQWMLSLFNNNLNGILADEMGLGKTIQTISLIAYLMENKGVTGPHLIVAPKAVLPNWIYEFTVWAPSINAVVYDGRQEERKGIRDACSAEGSFHVMITHYDLIMRDKTFFKKIHWYYMIVDEGHRLKNHDSVLAQTIVHSYRIRRRLLLTGTPIQNSLQELWSLLNFLLPNIFNSVSNFEDWFNAPFADKSNVTLTEEEELLVIRRLHHVIRPFILRRKKDEVEKFLPGKTQVILKCDMSAWQRLYYQQITDVGRVGLDNGKGKSLQNLTMHLRKCCNHPYLFVHDYNMRQKREEIYRASGKFELLDRLLPKLRRAGHRVLLFSQMTKLMDILEVYLNLHDFKYLRLDGTTKTEERGALLREFNAPNSSYFMFLLSTRAGGLGLNLQTADTVIIFDSDWNPQMDQQAEDRAHRIGQKKEVRVFVLVSVGSIEEVILERAKQKMGIDAKVIQAGLFNTTSTAQDRRDLLEEIMRKGTSTLGTDVPSEREINRLAARTDEEFWLFEKMDEERRRKEGYRCRLMEEHEVPEWAYAAPPTNEQKGKGFEYESANVHGKRRRKEVVYADTYNDQEWTKAGENQAEWSSKHPGKGKKRKVRLPVSSDQLPHSNNAEGGEKERGKEEIASMAAETLGNNTFGTTSRPTKRLRLEEEEEDDAGPSKSKKDGALVLTWKTHKKKRSSLAP